MKKILSLLIVTCLAGLNISLAQEENYKKCGTVYPSEEELQQNPLMRQSLEELEEFTKQFTENYESYKLQQNTPYIIPVVFHIIHTYSSNFISDAQVYDALDVINKDFRKLNADISQIHPNFIPIAADAEIEFRIARIDPNGNCTKGITRTYSERTLAADDSVKTLIGWDQSKYLNVWVVQTIASGAGGYAYYPSSQPQNLWRDGIVIRHAQFGSIGTSSPGTSRSLSHEIGHYLNLKHTWGASNNPGLSANCFDDDGVNDTPNTIGNTVCNINAFSCGSLDNVHNFMEYTFCERMFTEGQKVRMHAALNSSTASRNNLWTQTNLIATGTNDGFISGPCIPIADFRADGSEICVGSSVSFNDFSWNGDIDTYNWSFPGGTPSTSNLSNPVIQYNTPGIYSVTLTVGNAAGSDTKTLTDIIYVKPSVGSIWLPTTEDFENIPSFPSSDWIVLNEGGNTWEKTSTAAYSGTNSVRIYNFSGNISGKKDVFVSPNYNLSNVSNAFLKFKLAFAVKSPSGNDRLKVFASNTCGQIWHERYSNSGDPLATAGWVWTNFVPTSSNQWEEIVVNLTSVFFSGNPNVIVKFEYTHDVGNNIYIDDINLDGIVSTGDEIETVGLNLYPNPATTVTRVEFNLSKEDYVTIKLLDVLGREIKTVAEGRLPTGAHHTEINDLETAGVYFVKLIIGQDEVVNKLVVR